MKQNIKAEFQKNTDNIVQMRFMKKTCGYNELSNRLEKT